MQQRMHHSWYKTFPEALVAKNDEMKADPKHSFQIRKKQQGERFELVIRLSPQEIKMNPERVKKTRRPH